MSDRLRIVIFFTLILGLLFSLGRVGLPLAHEWLDPVAVRDSGTMFPYLASRPNALRSLALASVQHVKGPVSYIAHNVYCLAVGDLFPLSPATMEIPNVIIAFLTCLCAFLLYRNFFSERVAYLAVITLAFFPWLALAIRFPYHFYVAPSLLHFSTIYFFASLMKEPESLFYKIAAPVSLTIYISYGQDWPMLHILFIGLFLSKWKVPRDLAESLQRYSGYCHFVSYRLDRGFNHKIRRGGSSLFTLTVPVLAVGDGHEQVCSGEALEIHVIAMGPTDVVGFHRAGRICAAIQKTICCGQSKQKHSGLDVYLAHISHSTTGGFVRNSPICICSGYAHCSAGCTRPLDDSLELRARYNRYHGVGAILLHHRRQFPIQQG